MSINITPSTKVGRGYINPIGGKTTIKNESFVLDYQEKTGKIKVIGEGGEVRGEGELKKNEKPKSERSPDFGGWVRIDVNEFEIIAYKQESLGVSVFEDAPEGGDAA